MTLLATNANERPKITDFSSAILLAQQAYEIGYRGATGEEFYKWIKSNLDLVGLSNTAGLPEEFPTAGSTLSATENGQWTILGPGTYNKVLSGTIEVTDNELAIVQFQSGDFNKVIKVPIPVQEGTDVLVPGGNGIPKEKAVAEYVKPIFDLTEAGKNLADKSKFKLGRWHPDGTLGPSSAYIATPLYKVLEGQTLTIQGHRNNSASVVRAVFFDNYHNVTGQILYGNGTTQTTFTPLQDGYVGINITDSLSGGTLDDNVYSNTFQLEVGSVATEYSPYTLGLKEDSIPSISSEKIYGLNEVIENNKTVKSHSDVIELVLNDFELLSVFDGTAYANLENEIEINNIGDFFELEFTPSTEINNYSIGLQLIGKGQVPTTNVFGIYSSNSIWMRENEGGAYKTWNLPLGVLGSKITLKLDVNTNNMWELSLNGESIGEVPKTGSFVIKEIGNAYSSSASFFKGVFKHLSINSNGSAILIDDFTQLNNINVESRYVKKEENSEGTDTYYSEMFYEFSPTMYNNKEGFLVYSKIKGSNNHYVRHELFRNYDMSELIYCDYYKLNNCSIFTYNGSSMTPLGVDVYLGSENEFTLLEKGKTDHTGGYHGDEIFKTALFKANGLKIDMSSRIELTPCDIFEYNIVSDLHETASSATPNEPIPDHPVIAEHIKTVVISPNKTTIYNVVEFKKAIQVVRAYTGLVCLAKPFSQEGYTENGKFAVFNNLDGTTPLEDNNANTVYYNGYYGGATITSDVINVYKPSVGNNVHLNEYKNNRYLWVTDRSRDSKYYRTLGYRGNTNSVTTEVGEIWKMQCEIVLVKGRN